MLPRFGQSIRTGQDAGEIRSRGGDTSEPLSKGDNNTFAPQVSPYDFATKDDLAGNGAGIYAMTDGIDDEQTGGRRCPVRVPFGAIVIRGGCLRPPTP
ncbi:MAG TPA: hypothetical protein VGL75_10930 [Acidothermaceae bacterium]